MAELLRPMSLVDLDTVLAIQREGSIAGLSDVFPQDEYPFPTDTVRQRWVNEIDDPDVECYVVTDTVRGVAGFAVTRNDEFLHLGTAVHTWGTGVASRAHDAVVDRLRSAGRERGWLRVFEGNGRGSRFYDKHGWQPTGERSLSAFAPHPVLLHYARDF